MFHGDLQRFSDCEGLQDHGVLTGKMQPAGHWDQHTREGASFIHLDWLDWDEDMDNASGCPKNHRITECIMLKETIVGHLVQLKQIQSMWRRMSQRVLECLQ